MFSVVTCFFPDSIPPFLHEYQGNPCSIFSITAAPYPVQQSLKHDSLFAPHCTVNETIEANTVVQRLILCSTDLSVLQTP